MAQVYFISDLHFGHKNIGKLRGMDSDAFDEIEAKFTERKLKVLDKLHGFHNE